MLEFDSPTIMGLEFGSSPIGFKFESLLRFFQLLSLRWKAFILVANPLVLLIKQKFDL